MKKDKIVFKARIKKGTVVSIDRSALHWGEDEGSEDIVFDCHFDSLTNDSLCIDCKADGYGVMGKYGNGSVTIWKPTGLIMDEENVNIFNEVINRKIDYIKEERDKQEAIANGRISSLINTKFTVMENNGVTVGNGIPVFETALKT